MAFKVIAIDETQIHEEQTQALIKRYNRLDPEEIRQIYNQVLATYTYAVERKFISIVVRKDVKAILSKRVTSNQTA
ncbi:MAG: hypothetical protein Q8R30_03110 [bacterium]|nr:hypothetical protein [bacterium]MDZ4286047.1 hypothetical protein [Candidatus Sungbacteria bacterium]